MEEKRERENSHVEKDLKLLSLFLSLSRDTAVAFFHFVPRWSSKFSFPLNFVVLPPTPPPHSPTSQFVGSTVPRLAFAFPSSHFDLLESRGAEVRGASGRWGRSGSSSISGGRARLDWRMAGRQRDWTELKPLRDLHLELSKVSFLFPLLVRLVQVSWESRNICCSVMCAKILNVLSFAFRILGFDKLLV